MKTDNAENESRIRVVLITTGFSRIVDSLCHNQNIELAGIYECRYVDNNCCDYANQNRIHHGFHASFVQMTEWLDGIQADLIITYKVPFLLPETIFEKPRYGSINIHPSLLPQYRGVNPWFGIYYNMETKSGVTIHKIDKYEDHGHILAQASFLIAIGTPLPALQSKAEKKAVFLLKQVFSQWRNIRPIPQDDISSANHTKSYFNRDSLLKLAVADGKRLWHVLRGFPYLLNEMYPELTGYYSIGEFLSEPQQEEIGNLVYAGDRVYLACCNGIIEILTATTHYT